ncbi:MAG: hypothetical protein RLZZ293_725, partial [Pseudomonadota bacterium]
PGTIEKQYIPEYAGAGINRISLGIQSFNNQHLQGLGRIHNANEALVAIETVAKHFTNFNLDIIYGLANQTLIEAQQDILQAIACQPQHISAYNLTIEPNTHFAKFTPDNLPDQDNCYQMQEIIAHELTQAGFAHYEVSAFAKTGYQSQHNKNYWQFGDYLGIGAGAHSKLSFHDQILRQARYKHPQDYMQRVKNNQHINEQRVLSEQELGFEFMMNALRLIDGFPSQLFTQTTGLSLGTILPKLQQAEQKNFITLRNNQIQPTSHGIDFLNNLLELFL